MPSLHVGEIGVASVIFPVFDTIQSGKSILLLTCTSRHPKLRWSHSIAGRIMCPLQVHFVQIEVAMIEPGGPGVYELGEFLCPCYNGVRGCFPFF